MFLQVDHDVVRIKEYYKIAQLLRSREVSFDEFKQEICLDIHPDLEGHMGRYEEQRKEIGDHAFHKGYKLDTNVYLWILTDTDTDLVLFLQKDKTNLGTISNFLFSDRANNDPGCL